ncbi:N-acetyltransferase family protein [Leifsonia sp. EB34]|uniref:GNAT family N-acetyltransferase n=1 Tax=Leifsonia sp. EB34 TaxID=3156303 RepID=UPI0035111392
MIAELDLPVSVGSTEAIRLRRAMPADLDRIIELLADDPVSATRGDVAAENDRPAYEAAFAAVQGDAANEIIVATDRTGRIVGTLQLTRIPGMTRRGSTTLLVESVRVSSSTRSTGIGTTMMGWVLRGAAPSVGAGVVQLTSDAQRADAHRFYERLGFVGSHIGFKYRVAD